MQRRSNAHERGDSDRVKSKRVNNSTICSLHTFDDQVWIMVIGACNIFITFNENCFQTKWMVRIYIITLYYICVHFVVLFYRSVHMYFGGASAIKQHTVTCYSIVTARSLLYGSERYIKINYFLLRFVCFLWVFYLLFRHFRSLFHLVTVYRLYLFVTWDSVDIFPF